MMYVVIQCNFFNTHLLINEMYDLKVRALYLSMPFSIYWWNTMSNDIRAQQDCDMPQKKKRKSLLSLPQFDHSVGFVIDALVSSLIDREHCVYKDVDWIKAEKSVVLPPDIRELFFQQLKSDCTVSNWRALTLQHSPHTLLTCEAAIRVFWYYGLQYVGGNLQTTRRATSSGQRKQQTQE